MQKFEQTIAGRLKVGDRFYKATDKKKTVYEIVEGEVKNTHWRTYRMFCCPAVAMDNEYMDARLKAYQNKPIQSDTKVVYLRSKEVAHK